jgi:hypothetical protein
MSEQFPSNLEGTFARSGYVGRIGPTLPKDHDLALTAFVHRSCHRVVCRRSRCDVGGYRAPLVSHGKQINLRHGWIEVRNLSSVTADIEIKRVRSDIPIDRGAALAPREVLDANSCCYEADGLYDVYFMRLGVAENRDTVSMFRLRTCVRDGTVFGYASIDVHGPSYTRSGVKFDLVRVDRKCP